MSNIIENINDPAQLLETHFADYARRNNLTPGALFYFHLQHLQTLAAANNIPLALAFADPASGALSAHANADPLTNAGLAALINHQALSKITKKDTPSP